MRLFALLIFAATCIAPMARAESRVLFVLSNVGKMQPGNVEVGNYQPEVAPPFQTFVDAGYIVDFVSPKGGTVPLYGPRNSSIDRTRARKDFAHQAAHSMPPADIDPAKYAAVLYVGGYGVLFDLPQDKAIAAIAAAIHRQGGVIGASGHGPVSLATIEGPEGNPLLAGVQATGFPNISERRMSISDGGKLIPLTVEDNLRTAGADFKGPDQISNDAVIVDHRIVTTMYAFGATAVAEAMIELLEAGS